jgi:hypothetical protein
LILTGAAVFIARAFRPELTKKSRREAGFF